MSQSEFDSALPNGIGLAPYLRMKQEGMTENESRIVEWLLKPGNLSCAPAIKDVAEALAVSEAMIVKVSFLTRRSSDLSCWGLAAFVTYAVRWKIIFLSQNRYCLPSWLLMKRRRMW